MAALDQAQKDDLHKGVGVFIEEVTLGIKLHPEFNPPFISEEIRDLIHNEYLNPLLEGWQELEQALTAPNTEAGGQKVSLGESARISLKNSLFGALQSRCFSISKDVDTLPIPTELQSEVSTVINKIQMLSDIAILQQYSKNRALMADLIELGQKPECAKQGPLAEKIHANLENVIDIKARLTPA